MKSYNCECADQGCKAHQGVSHCENEAISIVHRIDMQDEPGMLFCSECIEDALESGLFIVGEDIDGRIEVSSF